jgi:hypothetical protein
MSEQRHIYSKRAADKVWTSTFVGIVIQSPGLQKLVSQFSGGDAFF